MNLKSKLEDITFSVIQHLPIVPSFLMNWADDYLSRRITELEHETVRQQWDKASLEKTLSEIHERQQDKEKGLRKKTSPQKKERPRVYNELKVFLSVIINLQ